MPRVRQAVSTRTTNRDVELGRLVEITHDLDDSWMERGTCRRWNQGRLKPSPWQVHSRQVVDGVKGTELIKMALMICHNCPAQYDCVTYAVKGWISAGTWGLTLDDLEWLQRQRNKMSIIGHAKRIGEPVQVTVTRRRAA